MAVGFEDADTRARFAQVLVEERAREEVGQVEFDLVQEISFASTRLSDGVSWRSSQQDSKRNKLWRKQPEQKSRRIAHNKNLIPQRQRSTS